VSRLALRILESSADLRSEATAWNDLWQRSEVRAPSAQAELIATWIEHFAPMARFRALVVEQSGQFVAALPLVERHVLGLAPFGALPCNSWAASGDLLLEPDADTDVLPTLLAAADASCWSVFHLEHVAYEAPRWKHWRAALEGAGWSGHTIEQHVVGQVEIKHDWQAYLATRKGRHRQRWRRYSRMLEGEGETELHVYPGLSEREADALLERGFRVEHESWKGREGTSALENPTVLAFYKREARELARKNQLELVFLQHNGRDIAFCYGWNAKDTRFCVKLGYDESYARLGPGQQQMLRLLEHVHSDTDCNTYDFHGRLVPWSESWINHRYPVGRLIFSAPRIPYPLLARGHVVAVVRGKSLRNRLKEAAKAARGVLAPGSATRLARLCMRAKPTRTSNASTPDQAA
jgi:CelD/BcsL family acetyltransferase involved in cellulose biosynthesis